MRNLAPRPLIYPASQRAALLFQPNQLQKGQQTPIRFSASAAFEHTKQKLTKQATKSAGLPMLPGFTLAPNSDSGLLEDSKTTATSVDLFGLTSPNARVTLQIMFYK